ncbi:DUF6933 domain-containing protein [Paenibacillus sp. NPDC058910]|uniref:DUF6933 domain-containing protein n=1 Tax=unclassified Paenibacillus TaxID=185978 RepID=UPI0036CC9FDD
MKQFGRWARESHNNAFTAGRLTPVGCWRDFEEAVYTTTNNRSVLRTLNDIVLIMQEVRKEFDNYYDLNRWNNDRVYKSIDLNNQREYLRPIDLFNKELEKRYIGLFDS